MTYKIHLGRNQVAVSFGRKRGRPGKSPTAQLSEFLSYLVKIGTNRRLGGHPLSRVLRRVVENKKARQIFGLNIAMFALLSGTIIPSISAFSEAQEVEVTAVQANQVQLTTQKTIRNPLETFKVSQGYHFFHKAIDLKEETGAPIYPIMDGKVKEITYGHLGYGNSVLIDHGSGFESLYAHMSKIVVEKDEDVDQATVLGTVGSTGFSTGSHLHLEVYDHGEP